MKTSERGINLIKRFEAYRDTAYKNYTGTLTIGYGHTNGIYKNMKINSAEAEEFLRQDILEAELSVMKYDSKYHWTQNEFDALVDFAFDIGSINQLTAKGTRTKKQISEKILDYKKAGKKVLQELVERRLAEKALFDEE